MSGLNAEDLEIPRFPNLSDEQSRAIYFLKSGYSYTDTATMVGVARQTLWRWSKTSEFQEAFKIQVGAELFRADFDLLTRTGIVQDKLLELITSNDTEGKVRLDAIKTFLTYASQIRKRADERWPEAEPLEMNADFAVDDLLLVIEARAEAAKMAALENAE